MNTKKKSIFKYVLVPFCTLLIFTFVMSINNMSELKTSAAYSQISKYFGVNGGSFSASHSQARYYSSSSNWLSVTPTGKGDSYKITVKPSTSLSSTQTKRSASFDLLDSKKNVICRYWVYQDVPYQKTTKTPLKINSCTGNSSAHVNERANLTVNATGDGLIYEWHYKNPGKGWVVSKMYTSNKYSCIMVPEKDGQLVYCKVKDKYGNAQTTDTVTLKAVGHTGSWITTKEATCITSGFKSRYCSGCNMQETVVIPALGSKYLGSVTVDGKSKDVYMVGDLTYESKYSDAIIVYDAVEPDGYVNYQVRDSYKITNTSVMSKVCDMIISYNKDAGRTSWNRSNAGCVAEWVEHNALYLVPISDIKDSARHVDLDEAAEGTPAEFF